MVRRIKTAVFPVGGLGTRFLPATKAMPKEMLPIVDKPIIQYAVEEAREAGIEHFIFVTGRGKVVVEDHFDNVPELERVLKEHGKVEALQALRSFMPESGQISFTRQREALGLGHAVWCARKLVGEEPFAVILPDDLIKSKVPCLKQMMDVHVEVGGNVIAVMDVPKEHTKRYGILDVVEDSGRRVKAKGMVEKPEPKNAPSTLAIIGRYILHPEIFTYLDRWERGAGNEIQLTDAIAQTIDTIPLNGYRFEGKRFDCGDKVGFLHANIAYALDNKDLSNPLREILRNMEI